ncbi:MAG: LamG domain-containing protein, partial [Planctomycetota bacterium]
DRALTALEIQALFRGGDLELAWAPDPFNGERDVSSDVILTWKPGDFAAQHDVYFGTDRDAVTDANTAEPLGVYIGRRGPNSYDPEGVELETTYYWRIDEVNDPCVWKGKIWKFTVANYVLIDDFESYNTLDNKIFDTWLDGAWNGTGSFIDLGREPSDPTHESGQSMLYMYDNTIKWDGFHYWSEAELPFDGPQDWTEADVKMLTLYFYGDPDNDAGDTEQFYVGLGGSYAQVNCPDMNDILKSEWTEWNIVLTDFNGVNLTAVTSLFIGFGDSDNESTPGGDGAVYFDDIRLYPPKCVPELGPAADFSDNCIVDWADVRIMANEWLRTDAMLTVSAPSPGPVGWWEFEEGGGSSVGDSSGYGNDGTAEGTFSWVQGRIGNGAMAFNDGRVLVPDAPELRPAAEITAAAWVYYSATPSYSARVVVKGVDQGDRENFAVQVTDEDQLGWFVRDSNTTNHGLDSEDELRRNEWTHLAGTYDGNAVACYVNGQLSNSSTVGAVPLLQDTNELAIGDAVDVDRAFIGTVDDVQVYDYALSYAEVAYLATEGTGYLALVSQVNLYDAEPPGEQAINLRDIAVFLDSWLEEKLWP